MLWAAGYGWDSFLIGRHVTFGNPPVEHKLIMTSLSFILNQCLFSHMCLSLFLILEGTRKTSDEYMSYRSNALVLLLDTNPQNSSCKNKIIQLPWWWGNQILTGVSWFPVHQARDRSIFLTHWHHFLSGPEHPTSGPHTATGPRVPFESPINQVCNLIVFCYLSKGVKWERVERRPGLFYSFLC